MRSLGKQISSVQFRVRAPQSSQRSSGFHKPAVSGAAPEAATSLRLAATARQGNLCLLSLGSAVHSTPPSSSLQIAFVKQSRRINTGWRTHFVRARTPTAETRRRERRQCGRESCREHQFRPASIKVMQRTFNPLNRERYPGGPLFSNDELRVKHSKGRGRSWSLPQLDEPALQIESNHSCQLLKLKPSKSALVRVRWEWASFQFGPLSILTYRKATSCI